MTLLNKDEISYCAYLHMRVMQGDFLPMFGKFILRIFYSYISSSPKEKMFVKRIDGTITSICIISFDPNSLMNRIIRQYYFSLTLAIIIHLIIKPSLLLLIISIVFHKKKFSSDFPEISYIFTDPKYSNNGFGSSLIKSISDDLKESKYNELYVKTINNDKNKAISFYKKNGFEICRYFCEYNRNYIYMKKILI